MGFGASIFLGSCYTIGGRGGFLSRQGTDLSGVAPDEPAPAQVQAECVLNHGQRHNPSPSVVEEAASYPGPLRKLS